MRLATRISAFFLILLAVVLAGFSTTLYLLARTYLVRQLDDRLQRALDTLEAAVDIEPGGLEWEPQDRRLALGSDPGVEHIRWTVRDGGGRTVDHSENARSGEFPASWTPASWPTLPPDGTRFGDAPGWRMAGRRLLLEDLLRQGRGDPDDEPGYEVQYPALVLIAGLSPSPVEAALNRLGLTLMALAIGVWIAAAAAGFGLSRRALAPVSSMAKAATAMTAANLEHRLPIPRTDDELGELGRAFNDLLDRLHEAFDRQQEFAGNASHQLRTPLAALLGQVQVALRRDRSPDEYRRVLERVRTEGVRLRQIVESLLLLAEPESLRPEPEVIDLCIWIPDHLRRWAAHSRAADLRAEVADCASLTVLAHPPLLAQLVDNLLENAFKYSALGTPVVIRAWRADGSVALGVEDHGRGLHPGDVSRVFEPFFRGEQARRDGTTGVGLGLALARRIASTFGGTLEVRSQPGKGCLFVLRLPKAAGAVEACDAHSGGREMEE